MKINLQLLHIYLAKIYPRYNLASIIKFLVHRAIFTHWSWQLVVSKFVLCITAWKHNLAMWNVVPMMYVLTQYHMGIWNHKQVLNFG